LRSYSVQKRRNEIEVEKKGLKGTRGRGEANQQELNGRVERKRKGETRG